AAYADSEPARDPAARPRRAALAHCAFVSRRLAGRAGLHDFLHRALRARRALPSRFALGVEHTVKLTLRNRSARPVLAAVVDEIPASFELLGELPPVRIPAQGEAQLNYVVRPLQRGAHDFGAVVLR